jgi:hypothetical protein
MFIFESIAKVLKKCPVGILETKYIYLTENRQKFILIYLDDRRYHELGRHYSFTLEQI